MQDTFYILNKYSKLYIFGLKDFLVHVMLTVIVFRSQNTKVGDDGAIQIYQIKIKRLNRHLAVLSKFLQ